MIATLVTQNGNAAQIFFLIALIAFIILGVVAAIDKAMTSFVMAVGLAVTAAGLLSLPNLPTVGGDANIWGSELNGFLSVAHNGDGTLKQSLLPLGETVQLNQQANYQFNLADANTLTPFTNSTDPSVNAIIPLSTAVPYPLGTTLSLVQMGTATVNFVGATGVTVNGANGASTQAQFSVMAVVLVATDSWVIFGDAS